MNPYRVPLDDITEALAVAGFDELAELAPFASTDTDAVRAVVGEFARFAEDVVAPTAVDGDRIGATWDPDSGEVTVPESFHPAYAKYVDAGWNAVGIAHPGHDEPMPGTVVGVLGEILASANLAMALNPMLTQAAAHLVARFGDEAQQRRYLTKLATGEWTGTMVLTEAEAGTDLSAIRTSATRLDDGSWELRGSKIFITWGEHPLTDNTVHCVLARTPGGTAPGLSLFLVPRFHVDDRGVSGARNGVRCVGIEHKLGIHASPTCVMEFDAARAELIGEEGAGLQLMFTMMNRARLAIAVQAVGVAERATQLGVAYAHTRRQGRAVDARDDERSLIVEHPDVRRMLSRLRATTVATRLMVYTALVAGDSAGAHDDPAVRADAQARVDLLTPIAKAWCTDQAFEVCSTALQIHGGMGYIEETGVARVLRDSRIGPIYEGTNGIQAIDLVGRKIRRDRGAAARALLDEIDTDVGRMRTHPGLGATTGGLTAALTALSSTIDWVTDAGQADALAGATPLLHLFGTTVASWLLARRVLTVDTVARGDDGGRRAVADCEFFATAVLAPAVGSVPAITAGADVLRAGWAQG